MCDIHSWAESFCSEEHDVLSGKLQLFLFQHKKFTSFGFTSLSSNKFSLLFVVLKARVGKTVDLLPLQPRLQNTWTPLITQTAPMNKLLLIFIDVKLVRQSCATSLLADSKLQVVCFPSFSTDIKNLTSLPPHFCCNLSIYVWQFPAYYTVYVVQWNAYLVDGLFELKRLKQKCT